METSLHRELKSHYAESDAATEVRLGRFRIDAVSGGELIEIQFASLSAIRDKIAALVRSEQVRIVKPIVARRRIIRQQHPEGPVVSRRMSPKRGVTLDLFDELVYLTQIFPHPNLIIEVPLVSVEEWRLPPPTRWPRRRRYKPKHQVKDVVLSEILSTDSFATTADLLRLVRAEQLPMPFETADLVGMLECSRPVAQRIAYVLRQTGAAVDAGRRGNAILYSLPAESSPAASSPTPSSRVRKREAAKRTGKRAAKPASQRSSGRKAA